MHELKSTAALDQAAAYQLLNDQLQALIGGERDWIANLANAAALLYHSLPDVIGSAWKRSFARSSRRRDSRLSSAYPLARAMYSPVRVSTRIVSPSLMNSGTRTTAPVSSLAGLAPPVAVSPRNPGSVSTIFNST